MLIVEIEEEDRTATEDRGSVELAKLKWLYEQRIKASKEQQKEHSGKLADQSWVDEQWLAAKEVQRHESDGAILATNAEWNFAYIKLSDDVDDMQLAYFATLAYVLAEAGSDDEIDDMQPCEEDTSFSQALVELFQPDANDDVNLEFVEVAVTQQQAAMEAMAVRHEEEVAKLEAAAAEEAKKPKETASKEVAKVAEAVVLAAAASKAGEADHLSVGSPVQFQSSKLFGTKRPEKKATVQKPFHLSETNRKAPTLVSQPQKIRFKAREAPNFRNGRNVVVQRSEEKLTVQNPFRLSRTNREPSTVVPEAQKIKFRARKMPKFGNCPDFVPKPSKEELTKFKPFKLSSSTRAASSS